MICCLIPDDGGPSFLWGTWLALGYAGLRIESLWGMLYPFAVALVRMWRFNADGVAANEYLLLIRSRIQPYLELRQSGQHQICVAVY